MRAINLITPRKALIKPAPLRIGNEGVGLRARSAAVRLVSPSIFQSTVLVNPLDERDPKAAPLKTALIETAVAGCGLSSRNGPAVLSRSSNGMQGFNGPVIIFAATAVNPARV